jgi:nicotinamidase/pyrazinamidase
MNRCLICVDVQPDFLPGGPLGVGDGHLVVRPLIRLMDDVDIIVLTRDWHPVNHVSFSTIPEFRDGSWPMHCVEFTSGAAWDKELLDAAAETGKPVVLVHKGFDPDKEAYSGFDGEVAGILNNRQGDDFRDSTLAQTLQSLSVRQVYIGGLALDYCVEATAIDAAPTFNTTVFMDATRPVSYLGGHRAARNMSAQGVHINAREVGDDA